MTPEEARKLLDGITPAPWKAEILSYEQPPYLGEFVEFWVTAHNNKELVNVYDIPEWHANEIGRNFTLMAAAPDMAAMIAGMTTEYSVERNCSVIEGEPDWEKIGFGMHPGIIANTFWTTEKKLAEKLYKEAKTGHLPVRIVRRYVTEPQPLGEEQ